jgi:hypothetical protein
MQAGAEQAQMNYYDVDRNFKPSIEFEVGGGSTFPVTSDTSQEKYV